MRPESVTVIGAGLSGPLLAILLARRGFEATVYERRGDPRASSAEAGRSINLALAARGIRALEHAGVMERVRPLMIAMRGRMVHDRGRPPALQPYGQRPDEVIYSVGRAALNRLLIEEAARYPTVTLRFDQRCDGLDARGALRLRDEVSGRSYEAPEAPTIAADGAGSAVRASLSDASLLSARASEAKLRGPSRGRNSVAVKLPSVLGSAISMKPPRGQIWSACGSIAWRAPLAAGRVSSL